MRRANPAAVLLKMRFYCHVDVVAIGGYTSVHSGSSVGQESTI
jgi:hypothetical protein